MFFPWVCFAQNTTSLKITYNLYATDLDNQKESLYSSNPISVSNSEFVDELLEELRNVKSINRVFAEAFSDSLAVIKKPESFIRYVRKNPLKSNSQQINFLVKKLSELDTYKAYFRSYINAGCCINMHQRYREQYVIEVYENNHQTEVYTSRKSLRGARKIPWSDALGTSNFNPNIEKYFFKLIGSKKGYEKILTGERLKNYLVNEIANYYESYLRDLSAYEYYSYFNGLSADFEIMKIGNAGGSTGIYLDGEKYYYARLRSKSFLPQVDLMFYASKRGNNLYTSDSLLADYQDIANKVQDVSFIAEFLAKSNSTRLSLFYFDNKPINTYIVDLFNANPEKWLKYDTFLTLKKSFEDADSLPSYVNEDAERVSKELYTGCNYRFDKDFAENSIMFQLRDSERGEYSTWILLPDDSVLLYSMQGERVLQYHYSDFGKFKGVQTPCVLFNKAGEIIDSR